MRAASVLNEALIAAALLLLGIVPAWPNVTDTLTGLTPGDKIGCNYTFNDGSPSIPCAQDTVAADGTVSFLKPNANFNNVEYFDVTTDEDIVELSAPVNAGLDVYLTPGTVYPLVEGVTDTIVQRLPNQVISVQPFNAAGENVVGTFFLDETFDFTNGTSPGLPNVFIPGANNVGGYTGEAEVRGFDELIPEPSSLLTLAISAGGLLGCRCVRRVARRSD